MDKRGNSSKLKIGEPLRIIIVDSEIAIAFILFPALKKSLSLSLSHFQDYSKISNCLIRIEYKTISPKQSLSLK